MCFPKKRRLRAGELAALLLDSTTFELISVMTALKPKSRVDLGIWVWPKMWHEFGVNG